MEQHKVRPTIMIVDDSEEDQMIMESILAKEYSLKIFSQSQEALDFALSNPPDLILLDVMMPDLDGYEFCLKIRSNPKLEFIPVIFITSKNDDEDERRGFASGGSDFISKPINAPTFLARINTHLKIKLAIDYLKSEKAGSNSGEHSISTDLVKIIKTLCDNPFLKI